MKRVCVRDTLREPHWGRTGSFSMKATAYIFKIEAFMVKRGGRGYEQWSTRAQDGAKKVDMAKTQARVQPPINIPSGEGGDGAAALLPLRSLPMGAGNSGRNNGPR